MRDEDKSREQLLIELRQRIKDQEADALFDQAESDRTRDRLTAALGQYATDLMASLAETEAGKVVLAESQESLRISEQNFSAFHERFLANMSHEIRTPMAGVLGLTEILLHQELPAKVQDDLEMIRSSAESVMTLINDLFDLSRISQGKFDFHPTEEFDLRSMVRDAIGPFEFQARSKDLDFIVSIDESVPSQILCDKDRLGQVIKNLVSNAIKFTEQGFVRVHVKAEKNDEDTLRLNFTVADSGHGHPQASRKRSSAPSPSLIRRTPRSSLGWGLGWPSPKAWSRAWAGRFRSKARREKGLHSVSTSHAAS
jgi:signal transduction histidine kinase